MKKQTILIIHIVFWGTVLVILFLNAWLGSGMEGQPGFVELGDAIKMLSLPIITGTIFYMFLFYLFYFLKPKLFAGRNYGYKIGTISLVTIILIAVYLYTDHNFGKPEALKAIVRGFSTFLFVVIMGSLFRFAIDWIQLKTKSDELQKQNLQGELSLLKNQINPHFFFNTLNNIDSLIKSNAEKASATLVKLSEIMRYMIYETKEARVPLKNEIKHIENYVDLQRIQFANKDLVSFSVTGNPDNILIAPVLFMSFVENAFKHCTNKEADSAITIKFSIADSVVNFECINLYIKTHQINKDDSSGVGLDIVKRRLELLYPKNHELEIKEEDDRYKVTLSIKTNGN
jgi:hypothetical protein